MGSSNLFVGVLGNGDIAVKTVKALLSDRVNGRAPRFAFPLTDEHWTPAVRAAAQWALGREYPYEVILDGSEADLEAAEEIIEGATRTHKVAAVETKLVALLAEAQGDDIEAALLLSWDDGDDACQRALQKAIRREVPAYDMRAGLNQLSFDDEPSEPTPVAEPEPEQQPETDEVKPKRTRRTKAQIEADNAAAAAALLPPEPQADEAQASSGPQLNLVVHANGNGHQADETPVQLLGLAMYDLLEQAAKRGAALALAEFQAS